MSDITMDKRLELIQQIRTQNHQNRYDMVSREQLLYGKSYAGNIRYPENTISSRDTDQPISSFKIRLLLSLTLLMLMIVLDITDKSLGKINIKNISEALAIDYEARIEEQLQGWIEHFVTDSQAR